MFEISQYQSLYLKGIAIMLVVLGHLGLVYRGGAIGVHIFLIISGYGCYTSWRANGLVNYWRKKITRLYVPYLLGACFQLLVLKNYDWKIIIHTILGLDRGGIILIKQCGISHSFFFGI